MSGYIGIVQCEASGKGKLRVCFDNGISCFLYRSEAGQFSIHSGSSLTASEYDKLITEVLGKRAKKRAMHLLEKMDRTENQLRQKLTDSQYPPECVEEAIRYVKSYHYLDDSRYAQNFIRYAQEKMSRGQIRRKLIEKGISRDIIEECLEEYTGDEAEQICGLLRKRGFDPESADQKEFRRTYAFLARRGFQSSDILRAMKRNIL